MKIVDSATMASIDSRSQQEFAYPSILLMENAGIKSYQSFKSFIGGDQKLTNKRILFLAGKGNNGGDALVMARQCFLEGYTPEVVLYRDELQGDPLINRNINEKLGIPLIDYHKNRDEALRAIEKADILFDGLTGTGIKGELKGEMKDLVNRINSISKKFTVAIDVPSGISDDFKDRFTAVKADLTLTMGLPKKCLYLPAARKLCGTIKVIPLGFPPQLVADPLIPGELLLWEEFKEKIPPIADDTYKNRRGSLAIFAGYPGTTGAAVLSSFSAARSRAGLVTLFADSEIYKTLAAKMTSVMVRPWKGDSNPKDCDLSPFNAILAGPGWGIKPDRIKWIQHFIGSGLPGVLDADGLTMLAEIIVKGELRLDGRWILTPHPGEFCRLAGIKRDVLFEDPVDHVLHLCRKLEAVIVLKSHITVVGNPEGNYWILDGMNPAMATGGSGDVLAGIIAGFLAGGLRPTLSACAGVLLHHRIGKRAFREKGWFISEDLLLYISEEIPKN
ncbi:MAG: bifunctional ADP-dependent NAD(P)H-hydrate dehydratase/NAD(P)H-hydrate epimerase [Spirochaetes bacterium]|nr:MAG: bifunctional ADP-dependent NAD(P)H-hydrate dehydratase/NAD(P)H-hydrate epimerase [Spirochaetota bacterium]